MLGLIRLRSTTITLARKHACVAIQSCWRRFLAYQVALCTLFQKRGLAAIILQGFYRALSARRTIRARREDIARLWMMHASNVISAMFRRWQAKTLIDDMRLRRRQEEHEKRRRAATIQIQRQVRGLQARHDAGKMKARLHELSTAAIFIQRHCREMMRGRKKELLWSVMVTIIQTHARGFLCRTTLRRELWNALLIQSWWKRIKWIAARRTVEQPSVEASPIDAYTNSDNKDGIALDVVPGNNQDQQTPPTFIDTERNTEKKIQQNSSTCNNKFHSMVTSHLDCPRASQDSLFEK